MNLQNELQHEQNIQRNKNLKMWGEATEVFKQTISSRFRDQTKMEVQKITNHLPK